MKDATLENTPFHKASLKNPTIREKSQQTIRHRTPRPVDIRNFQRHIPPQGQMLRAAKSPWDNADRGAFVLGPCWISGELPETLAQDDSTHIRLVSSLGVLGEKDVSASQVSIDGRQFFLSACCQLGPVYLSVETSSRVDVFGPYTFFPWTHKSLGALTLPSTTTTEWPSSTFELQNRRDFAFAAVLHPLAGLIETPLLPTVLNIRQAATRSSTTWNEGVIPLQPPLGDERRLERKLGGPWDIMAWRPGGKLRFLGPTLPQGLPMQGSRLTFKNLSREDQLMFHPESANYSYLIAKSPNKGIVELPTKLRENDQLYLVRYGDKPRLLNVPEAPGVPVAIPDATALMMSKKMFDNFTLVREGLSEAERERVIKRNWLLFGAEETDSPQTARKTEEIDRAIATTSEDDSRISGGPLEKEVTLKLSPGIYDVFQLIGHKTGRREVVFQTEVSGASMTLVPKVTLTYSRVLRGTITDNNDGTPVAHAGIVVGKDLPSNQENMPWTAITDDAGEFSIRGLPPGELSLHVFALHHLHYEETIDMDDSGDATTSVAIHLERAPGIEISFPHDAHNAPAVDGFILVRKDGVVIDGSKRESSVVFEAVAPGQYVALAYLGTPVFSSDDWHWLTTQSGGLLIDHPNASTNEPYRWLSPIPQSVIVDLKVVGLTQEQISLQVVHAGEAPYPGIWPNQVYENLPWGLSKIDRLLPGRYRAIATWQDETDIVDFVVPRDKQKIVPLSFEFSKE